MSDVQAAGFKPKRGRPTAAQIVAIDSVILSVAREMFLENGYANTAMEAVATSAGVSKSTLYARYPSKPELFNAIAAERLSAWAETAPTQGAPQGGLRDRLIFYGVTFLDSFQNPEVAAFDRLIMTEASRFPEIAQTFHERGYLQAVDLLTAIIKGEAETNGPATTDARSVAVVFTSAILGWYRGESLSGPPSRSRSQAFIERLVAILLVGRNGW